MYKTENEIIEFMLVAALKSIDSQKHGGQSGMVAFEQALPVLKGMVKTVPHQGLVMDVLMRVCYEDPQLSDSFKACLLALYTEQIVDGNVIIAWYDRAQGNGKTAFSKSVLRFVEWLKQE